ncbi:MAG: ABC transporter permease [Nitrososphaerota archaeon]
MGLIKNLKTFKCAFWLGFKIESNWTDPFLFAIYSLIRPLSSLLIIIFVYIVGALSGYSNPDYATYMVLGNAFFIFAAQAIYGSIWMIHDDREHYQIIKYVYVSPSNFYIYYVGRGAFAFLLSSAFSSLITIFVGVTFLGVKIDFLKIDYSFFILNFLISLIGLISLSMILASIGFFTTRTMWSLSEGLAGLFFLFCGILFKPEQFPYPLQIFSYMLPLTYWVSLFRNSLLGLRMESLMNEFIISSGYTIFLLLFSIMLFRYSLRIAKKKGIIDAILTF